MNVTININIEVNVNVFLGPVIERLESIRQPVQSAMADAYCGVVLENFGASGVDRPWAWAPLSPSYAKKVGRSYATLVVSGALKNSVKKTDGRECSTVSMSDSDVSYATRHHHGGGNLPARRVFPIREDGSSTPGVVEAIVGVAQQKVAEVLK